jgi:S1-C subfamily serine protease
MRLEGGKPVKLFRWILACAILVGAGPFLYAGDDTVAAADAGALSAQLERIFSGEVPTSIDDLKAMQEHQRWLARKVIPCTVGVMVGGAQGSGVIVSKDGYVLTAAHVVGQPGRPVRFTMPDGSAVMGTTLGVNRRIDAGLMKITGDEINGQKVEEWPFLEMGSSTDLKPGQWCMATGHPGGPQRDREPVVRFGRILEADENVIKTDCKLVGGDSGGPLFDVQGRVIAIHSRIGGRLTDNLHVPVNTYREDWDRLAAGEEWGRFPGLPSLRRGPYLGVGGSPEGEEARIESVGEGTPAEKAGIKVGDVVKQFNGKEVSTFEDLQDAVSETRPGQVVKVVVERDGETKELEVRIERRGDRP